MVGARGIDAVAICQPNLGPALVEAYEIVEALHRSKGAG